MFVFIKNKQGGGMMCKCGSNFTKNEKTMAGGKVYRKEISALWKCKKCKAVRRTCYVSHNKYYENDIKTMELKNERT